MTDASAYAPTARTTPSRKPDRARYDTACVHAILDAGVICHIAYVEDGLPMAAPTIYWREGAAVYWHGSRQSHALQAMAAGAPVCFTVAHLDGLVLARSAFRHSANYRSVVAFGRPRVIEGEARKRAAMRAMIERLYPGRWPHIRGPSRAELAAISVLRLNLEAVSAKVREGPPMDAERDYDLPVWAGVAPLSPRVGELEPCARLIAGIPPPDQIASWTGPDRRGTTPNSL